MSGFMIAGWLWFTDVLIRGDVEQVIVTKNEGRKHPYLKLKLMKLLYISQTIGTSHPGPQTARVPRRQRPKPKCRVSRRRSRQFGLSRTSAGPKPVEAPQTGASGTSSATPYLHSTG